MMMGSSQEDLAKDLADRISGLGSISVHRYFSGASLRARGVQFAFVMKGVLYLKVNANTLDAFIDRGCEPFRYSGSLGPVTVKAYYAAPQDVVEDDRALSSWADQALRVAGGDDAPTSCP